MVFGEGVLFKKIRAQQLEYSTHTHTQVTPPVRRRRRRSVKEMGGISSKPEPGFPVDTSELDGDLRLEDEEEEEEFFSAQKVTEKDEEEEEEDKEEEEMTTIPETSSETQKARETREPGSASVKKKKKKRKIQTPHLSTGSYLPASSKHRVENELKRIDAVQLATKLDFVSPNYPSTRRSEQFKRHALRSSRRGELPTSSPQTTMEWA